MLCKDIWSLLSLEMNKAILDATAKVRLNRKAKAARTNTDDNFSTQSAQGYTATLSSNTSPPAVAEPYSTSTVIEYPTGILKKETRYALSTMEVDPKGDSSTVNEQPKGVPKKKTRNKLSNTIANPKGGAKIAFKDDDPKTMPLIEAGY
jgi:hypothetical protein